MHISAGKAPLVHRLLASRVRHCEPPAGIVTLARLSGRGPGGVTLHHYRDGEERLCASFDPVHCCVGLSRSAFGRLLLPLCSQAFSAALRFARAHLRCFASSSGKHFGCFLARCTFRMRVLPRILAPSRSSCQYEYRWTCWPSCDIKLTIGVFNSNVGQSTTGNM